MNLLNEYVITNLEESPYYRDQVIELIESSFGYSEKNSFIVDFYPLMNTKNQCNNHILIEDNKVIAHIGLSFRYITQMGFRTPVSLLGGICSCPSIRGKGIFSSFFKRIIENHKANISYFILWGNLTSFYERFDFYEAGKSIQTKAPGPLSRDILKTYNKVSFSAISDRQWDDIKSLYEQKSEVIKFHRSEQDWENITHIKSADLYLYEVENKVVSYFIKNKGQDLENLIHEYGIEKNYEKELLPLLKRQSLWMEDRGDDELGQIIYSAFFRIGNISLLNDFLKKTTHDNLKIDEINESISFSYKGETFECDQRTFLQVIHGPHDRKRKLPYLPVYFCGLDSV
ncbi:MAG: GNAT family N-acetyltransferase [Bacteriovoracaceae bacterium]